MKRGISLPSLFGMLTVVMFCTAGAHVTVYKIDDSIITGDILSVDGKTQTFTLSTTRPATQPTTRSSTQATTQAAAPPATQPVEIPLSQIVQVSFREAGSAPKIAAKPVEHDDNQPDSSDDSSDNSPSVTDAFSDLLGSNSATKPASPPTTLAQTQPTTAPVELTDWNYQFIDGGTIQGQLKSWSGNRLSVILDAPMEQTIHFPVTLLAEFWRTDATWRAKARALNIDGGEADVAYVEKEGNVVAVTGTAQDVEGNSLEFTFDNAPRKIALARLVGLVMGSASRGKPLTAFMDLARLDTGAVLAGTWVGADDNSIRLRTNWGQTLRIPLVRMVSIDAINGSLVYLSDLTPAKVEQTAYFGRVIGYQRDHGLDGGPIRLSDGTYAKGVAMHSRCILQYNAGGQFERFKARLGFEQPGGRMGRAAVRVLSDGRALYENPDARGDEAPVNIDLDISGCKNLTLEVDFGKDQDVGDRVVFASARLLRVKQTGRVSP